jgi:hypothetical protein
MTHTGRALRLLVVLTARVAAVVAAVQGHLHGLLGTGGLPVSGGLLSPAGPTAPGGIVAVGARRGIILVGRGTVSWRIARILACQACQLRPRPRGRRPASGTFSKMSGCWFGGTSERRNKPLPDLERVPELRIRAANGQRLNP